MTIVKVAAPALPIDANTAGATGGTSRKVVPQMYFCVDMRPATVMILVFQLKLWDSVLNDDCPAQRHQHLFILLLFIFAKSLQYLQRFCYIILYQRMFHMINIFFREYVPNCVLELHECKQNFIFLLYKEFPFIE